MSKKTPPRARAPKGPQRARTARRETASLGRRLVRALFGAVTTLVVVAMKRRRRATVDGAFTALLVVTFAPLSPR